MAHKSPQSRRRFIQQCLGTMALLPLQAWARNTQKQLAHPLPPGAISIDRFALKCTACQLCVQHCPSGVLVGSNFEKGLGPGKPTLHFATHRFCEYTCTTCIDICPVKALGEADLETKKTIKIGEAHLHLGDCVVIQRDTDCGACAEHCPTTALSMVPYRDGLTHPVLEPELCIGCGACVSICPHANRALKIEAFTEHQTAQLPEIKKQDDIKIDDFGF